MSKVRLVLLTAAMTAAAWAQTKSNDKYLVEFKGGQLPNDLPARIGALGGTLVDSFPEMSVAIVGNMTAGAAATLASEPDVADVTEDASIQVEQPGRLLGVADPRSALTPASVAHPEGAAFFPLQWGLRVIGADRAWQAGILGSPDVRLALIDSGIDPTYPDLAGLIDASRSISFVPSETPLVAQAFPGYPDWTDLLLHGTWVASIAASQAHIVAGVGSRTSLMAVKACGLIECRFSGILRGVHFAATYGADVINMSLGTTVPFPKAGQKGLHHYFHLAVQAALVQGVSAIVVSAGNSAIDLDHDGNGFQFLCDVPGVICVSASGPTDSGPNFLGPFLNVDASAIFTNFGSSAISVAAPGGNISFDSSGNVTIGSVVWGACASTDRQLVNGVLVPGLCSGNHFVVLGSTGTSGAAPHVSGLAALLVSQLGHGKQAQVKAAIQNSADDRGKPGHDPLYGDGRINVARALGIQ